MRQAFAILFSLLLVWAQAAPAAVSAPPAKAACDGCDCRVMSCCPAQAPDTAPATVPVGRDRVQTQCQFLAAPALLFILPEDELVAGRSANFLRPTARPRVPLFVRDCAYLV